MYQDDKNEYGCPLFDQNGRAGIRDFDAIVARLTPELRTAFEAERAARWLEVNSSNASMPYREHWEYRRLAALVGQLWIASSRLQASRAALIERIEQLRPWIVASPLTPGRIGTATEAARRMQAIPGQMRRLCEWVPIHGPSILTTQVATLQPLGRWLGVVDNLSSVAVIRTMRRIQRAGAARGSTA